MLKNNQGKSPYFLGPALVHQRKMAKTYAFLAQNMVNFEPKIKDLLAYGSDGETAISIPFKNSFPKAVHLLCSLHEKANIRRKLENELRLPKQVSEEFVADIFGRKFGTVFESGLADAEHEEEFFAMLASLEKV